VVEGYLWRAAVVSADPRADDWRAAAAAAYRRLDAPWWLAGNLYRLLALKLTRYQTATPDKIWRHFLDATGTLHITPGGVTCALNLRSHHPVLIDGGFADLEVPIPWWGGRTLRFRFPPR
jgi:hypothetical protein